MRIRIINPVTRSVLDESDLPPMPERLQVEVDWLEEGPSSIESRLDDALCVPPTLERVRQADQDRVDGIVINCFMDPGLHVAREISSVAVVGPAESSMLIAASLAESFSVILPAASGAPIVVEQATEYHVRELLASVRSVEMPVAELKDRQRLVDGLLEESKLALEEDGAHAIILGCTGMSSVTSAVIEALRGEGVGVPVIDPTLAAVGMLQAYQTLGVRHSGRTYAVPAWKASAAER